MTKRGFTPDQHEELGKVLAGITDELTKRVTELRNAYPKTGPAGAGARNLDTAITAIAKAREALENQLYDEHPLAASTQAYDPPSSSRATVCHRTIKHFLAMETDQ